jgi:hypothetical protein
MLDKNYLDFYIKIYEFLDSGKGKEMDINKVLEDLEKKLEPEKTGEDLIKELLEAGYKDFLFVQDEDAYNMLDCKDAEDVKDTLEEYTDEYTLEWLPERKFYYNDKDLRYIEIGEWQGYVSWEEDPPDAPWYIVHDERKDYILVDLRVEKDGVSLREFLKERLDLE